MIEIVLGTLISVVVVFILRQHEINTDIKKRVSRIERSLSGLSLVGEDGKLKHLLKVDDD